MIKKGIPATCKVIWIGTALHNLADGMILGLSPDMKVAIPLFIHEIVHTLCNVTFYITLGMTKYQAVILRIASCIFVFFGAFLGQLSTKLKSFHYYGHGLVLGIFIYMMLVDVLPIVTGNQQHNHCIDDEQSKLEEESKSKESKLEQTTNQKSEGDHEKTLKIEIDDKILHHRHSHHHHHHGKHSTRGRKLRLLLIFIISFGIVAASITVPIFGESKSPCGCGHGGSHDQHNVFLLFPDTSNAISPGVTKNSGSPGKCGSGNCGHSHRLHSF